MMPDNPYQSPPSPSGPPTSHDHSCDGVWRDGKMMVMRNNNPQFPRRCIKTDMPYAGPPTRIKLTWLENDTAWFLLLGALGRSAVMATQGKKVWVDIPVSDAWLAKRRRSAFIGWGLLLGGIAAFLLAIGLAVATSTANGGKDPAAWVFVLMVGGPVATLIGAFWLAIFQQPIITAKEITNGLAWIKGVHPGFLQSLPEWPWRENSVS